MVLASRSASLVMRCSNLGELASFAIRISRVVKVRDKISSHKVTNCAISNLLLHATDPAMDITGFVSTKRDRALQVGDYDSYRKSLSRQLLALRRRLHRTTPKNAKFTAKAPVTVEDIANNHECVLKKRFISREHNKLKSSKIHQASAYPGGESLGTCYAHQIEPRRRQC